MEEAIEKGIALRKKAEKAYGFVGEHQNNNRRAVSG
jgi:hypothetical protein